MSKTKSSVGRTIPPPPQENPHCETEEQFNHTNLTDF